MKEFSTLHGETHRIAKLDQGWEGVAPISTSIYGTSELLSFVLAMLHSPEDRLVRVCAVVIRGCRHTFHAAHVYVTYKHYTFIFRVKVVVYFWGHFLPANRKYNAHIHQDGKS